MADKVFDPTCSTRKVYEEGARDVALSALSGINGKVYNRMVTGKFSFDNICMILVVFFLLSCKCQPIS